MKENKKHLNVVQTSNKVVPGTTCFAVHLAANVDCQRQRCQYWIPYSEGHNCVHIAAQDGPHTLQHVGQIYDLTRMRICQIEKEIFEKVKEQC
jgi:hypothetical protein